MWDREQDGTGMGLSMGMVRGPLQIWEATAHWNFDTFDRRAERHLVSSHLIASLVMRATVQEESKKKERGGAVKLLKRFPLSLPYFLCIPCVTENQKDIDRSAWELDTCSSDSDSDSNSHSMHGLPHTCLPKYSHRQPTEKKTKQNNKPELRTCPITKSKWASSHSLLQSKQNSWHCPKAFSHIETLKESTPTEPQRISRQSNRLNPTQPTRQTRHN